MKNMRKLTALLLAVVMVLSLSIAVFARDGGSISDAYINDEQASIDTVNGEIYVRATLAGTTAYSKSEYSLRNAQVMFVADAVPTSTDTTIEDLGGDTYMATMDLFNKCCDVTVDGTVYHFAAGLESGSVVIDNNDPLKVTFTVNGSAVTNSAVNVQNPNIGNSGYEDGWTGIAYTASVELTDTNADLSALTLNVSMPSGTTISGTCITANTDGSYTLNMTNSDKTITVTNGSMSRNYYMAVTKVGESITVSIRFNTDCVSGSTQAESLQSKMRTASVGSTGTLYVTLSGSKTVMDALLAASSTAGFTVNYTGSTYGAYVTGIEGLNAGGAAGWMYKVNGWFPNYGCSRYQLQNGDVIEWVYTCDLGDDVGGGYATGSE